MRFDVLIDQLSATVASERVLLRRVARYVLPLLLLPLGPAVAQIPTGWLGLFAGGLSAMLMLAQAELFIKPTFERVRVIERDITAYLQLDPGAGQPSLAPAVPLILPAAAALLAGAALFMPAMLAAAGSWQRLAALALAAGALWMVWRRMAETVALLERVAGRLADARRALGVADRGPQTADRGPGAEDRGPEAGDRRSQTADRGPQVGERGARAEDRYHSPLAGPALPRGAAEIGPPSSVLGPARAGGPPLVLRLPPDGLLDPQLARRALGLPLPALRLSPAGVALLRAEAYLTLRDFPDIEDRALIDGLAAIGRAMYAAELRHTLLPPVGGKLYLPVAAGGTVAAMLGATARRLGMDGAYSGSLRTWLVRLPPARSYVVAGRLIDAVVALRLLPPGVLPHHLTVQGDLGPEARVLSILHLAAAPLLFEERPGSGRADERPFIMRGGGVLDDVGGRGERGSGPRTDFIDGFLFVHAPEMDAPEHLTGHTLNLRLKQVLAYGLLAALRPSYRRDQAEARAAAAFERLREALRVLLADYDLARALEVDWLDGNWSDIWPLIARMSAVKERSPAFLERAQQLRDAALDEIEAIAVAARAGR
ncbi:MAG TPA: hypothetical protein VNL77_18075 [Roseiflexaceae bacterium]|nr:hypothetical protein [Roseiflexaceae bacterium]